jgi:hypothetical protein
MDLSTFELIFFLGNEAFAVQSITSFRTTVIDGTRLRLILYLEEISIIAIDLWLQLI